MADPAMPTVPRVGKSNPPSNCSSVVLPEPDAPTMATRSPLCTRMLAPRSTCSVTPPWMNSLTRSTPSSTVSFEVGIVLPSIVSQGFSRQQARCAHRRIHGGDACKHECKSADSQDVRCPYVGRQVAHEVHARVEEFESDDGFQRMHQFLQIHCDNHAEQHTEQNTQHSDQTALYDEHRQDTAGRGAESAQDGNVATFILDHHDHGRDDVECSYPDHQRKNHEQNALRDRDRAKEIHVLVGP